MTCQISCVILSYCYKYIGSSSLRTAVILIGVDKMNTVDIIIIVVIAAVFVGAAALWAYGKRNGQICSGDCSRCKGGCNGNKKAAKAKNKDNYAYSQTFKISGMTCSNCAKRIENELNELDGVWADVNFESASAEFRAKGEINADTICGIVARLGYSAVRE